MREWWWRVRYAAWMWWKVPFVSIADAWELAHAFDFNDWDDTPPREAVDEELSYWTE